MATLVAYSYSASQDFPGGLADAENLQSEIVASPITTALDSIRTDGDTVTIYFKASLSAGDKTLLDGDTLNPAGGLIAAHDNQEPAPIANKVIIQEESTPTGGYFKSTTIRVDAPANSITAVDKSWLIPVSAYSLRVKTTDIHEGDVINMLVAPNTIVGAITAPVAINDTTIHVQQSVINHIKLGFNVNLFDGAQTADLGIVVGVHSSTLTIDVETPSTLAFSPLTPTYVRCHAKYVDDYEFGPADTHIIGDAKIGGTYIPTGTIIRALYHNKSLTENKVLLARVDLTF